MQLLSLIAASPCLAFAAPVCAGDPASELMKAAAREWSALEGRTLDDDVYRDKKRLCPKLEPYLGAEKPDAAVVRKATRLLADWIEKSPPAGLVWRVEELRARLFLGVDPGEASTAYTAALAAYPVEDYAEPLKHSYFHHLAVDAALVRWDMDGPDAAESMVLAIARDDARLQYLMPERLEQRYFERNDLTRWKLFRAQLATALELRLPDLARELLERPVPDVRSIDGDPKKRFLVLGAELASDAPRELVVVLPGGSGQLNDFAPWVTQLATPLLDRYVFVVLSAPVWNPKQARDWVWVTEAVQKQYKAEFSVESFAREVVAALRSDTKLKLGKAFLFAWSSGGPAAYATLIADDPTFAGAYVLASVFRAKGLKPQHAAGKRVWLEQGRADYITPLRFAQDAERWLKTSGAAVKLVEFDGGHGFAMPDASASLAAALAWLRE